MAEAHGLAEQLDACLGVAPGVVVTVGRRALLDDAERHERDHRADTEDDRRDAVACRVAADPAVARRLSRASSWSASAPGGRVDAEEAITPLVTAAA